MSELLTIEELRNDDAKLRPAAGEVLNPGPWDHNMWPSMGDQLKSARIGYFPIQSQFECTKCKQWLAMDLETRPDLCGMTMGEAAPLYFKGQLCPVPDSATGPLEVIAERLVKMTTRRDLENAILEAYRNSQGKNADGLDTVWVWFVYLDPTERIICCLLALGKVKI